MTLSYSERFVSDATPLMKIESIPGTYEMYKKILSELHIPSEVAHELARGPQLTVDEYLKLYDIADFIVIHPVQIDTSIQGIKDLDKGEAEALSLAKMSGYPLLIEERKGRRTAKENGISITGNGGLVLYGYAHEKISKEEALQYLDALFKAGCFKRSLHEGLTNALQQM